MIAEQTGLFEDSTVEAIRRRNEGMEIALTNDLNGEYRERLLDAIEVLALKGERFSADDARAIAGDPPRFTHPNVAGACFNAAARAGLIRMVGFGFSRRAVGHGNLVRIWQGVQ